jgi:hypothetical protein
LFVQRKRQTKEPLVNAAKSGDVAKTEQLITSGIGTAAGLVSWPFQLFVLAHFAISELTVYLSVASCTAAGSAEGRREYVNRQDKNGSTW